MRLTDRPKSLAETRPDVTWPDSLQATMDKALARDATARYQSAAQFGREFAEALHDMPAVAATEGATMVIGAQSASSGPTKPLPATRVSRGDQVRTPAKDRTPVPAAAPKKSIVPLAAGGGVLAVAAVAAWVMFGKPPAPGPTDPANGSAVVQDSTPADGGAGTQGTAPGTTLTSRDVNPDPTPPRTEPQPDRRPPATTSGTGTTGGAAPTPATPSPMVRMEAWVLELNAEDITPNRARQIAAEIEAMRPSLSGSELAESWYVSTVAKTALEDVDGICEAARQLQRLHREQPRLEFAAFTLRRICQ